MGIPSWFINQQTHHWGAPSCSYCSFPLLFSSQENESMAAMDEDVRLPPQRVFLMRKSSTNRRCSIATFDCRSVWLEVFFFRCSLQSLSSWIVFLNDKAILAPGGFVSWFYITIFSDEAEISVPIWSIWLWVMVWPKSRLSLPGLLTTLMLLNRLSLENIHLLRTWLLYGIIYIYSIYIYTVYMYIYIYTYSIYI